MYLQLAQVAFFFEKVVEPGFNYFNTRDYQICSADERQRLLSTDTYEETTFLLIPQIDRNEIAAKYLVEKNNRNLLREREVEDFYRKFHWYVEDNHLANDWNHFEKLELIRFAATWCERNQLRFTGKQ